MSRTRIAVIITAVVAVIAVILGIKFVFFNDSDNKPTDPRMAAVNNGTPFYDPSSSSTPTPAVETPVPSPTDTLVTQTPPPEPSSSEPTAPTVTKTPVVKVAEMPLIIGALWVDLPSDYERIDGSSTQAVPAATFIGPDNGEFNGRSYPSQLRLSAEGIMDMSDELADLKEGLCPFGDGTPEFTHREASSMLAGFPMQITRDTYVCDDSVFTMASWHADDGNGNRFDAEYFFLGDRRPAELTEAFENAKVIDFD